MNGMNFIARNSIKALVALIAIGVVGMVADRYLAASPSASTSKSTKADSRPRVEVVHPRRITVAQRLQTNATLEAFEETDLFAKISGYLSDVRVDIGDHVKAGQVLAVIYTPEMEKELAEAKAQLASKQSSLERARRDVDHYKANITLQDAWLRRREELSAGHGSTDRVLDEVRANAEIAKALYRWFPSVLKAITIIRPETLVRWHRAGFRRYWRWKSRPLGGRPQIDAELRVLIRRMSVDNPLWGAPRIHGELLKLGFEVAQSSVAKYMVKRCGPPSQGWCTFLRNHAPDIAAMDLFVVPTIGFDLLYAFVIVRLDRRDLVWINVTANLTAEWVARQITEAFPWDEAPHYLIRDRDRIYGSVVTRRLRAMVSGTGLPHQPRPGRTALPNG